MDPVLSIIVPTLNEEEGIEKTIAAVPIKQLKKMGYKTEIVVVDGLSTDRTVEIAKKTGARVVLEKRPGNGRALKTGFDSAKGNILIAADGDYTYPMEDIPKLLRIMVDKKLDFLNTNRFGMLLPGAMSFRNKVGNNILSITARLLFGIPFKDSQSGMWLMKKEVWKRIKEKVESGGPAFVQEIKIEAFRAGFRCGEASIKYRKREGETKLNPWRDGIGNMLNLIKKRFL